MKYRLSFRALPGLLLCLAPLSCAPEGEQLVPPTAQPADPCQSAEADLSDGLQTGSELRAVFDCANHGGQFNAFIPVMDAMETSLTSDGDRTILDMWVDILNEELDKAGESGTSVNPADLAGLLDDLLALLEEEWLPSAFDVLGDLLSSGAVEHLVPVLGQVAAPIVDQSSVSYEAYFDQLIQVLCPDAETKDECSGNVVQVLKGMRERSATYGQPDSTLSTGEETATMLSRMFAPAGDDEERNRAINDGLGRGIARLGKGDFLVKTLSVWVPALYGDDPETPELEGYDSFNANKSALYGIMSLMADPAYFNDMKAMMSALGPLVSQYYTFSPQNINGNGGPVKTAACDPFSSTNFAAANPANFGLAQVLRVLKAVDVDANDSLACSALINEALGVAGEFLELSGSTNIATVMLEVFSQLPVDQVQLLTDLSALEDSAYDIVNTLCGTHIIADDIEALQASVHIEAVIEPTLKLLAAINHAAKPGGIGGMETTKDLIVGLYNTQMLCEAQPWLAAVATKNGPLVDATDGLEPFLPGQPYHDKILLPLLKVVGGLGGNPAQTLIPPIAEGLTTTGEDLGGVLQGIGILGRSALEEAEAGGNPGLYELNAMMADMAARDPDARSIDSLVAMLEQRALVTGVLETVAAPAVQDAFGTPYPPEGGQTPVEFMADVVNSGDLLALLRLMQGLLLQVDAQL